MNRLTKIDRYGHFYTNKATCRNIYSSDGEKLQGVFFKNQVLAIDGKAIDKLGKLEDIEEELGIDLNTLLNKYIKWQKLDTYNTKENDWVLVLCKDKMNGQLYALPLIAELRRDGKWYSQEDVCLSDYLEIVAWKNIDVIYECRKLTKEEFENE